MSAPRCTVRGHNHALKHVRTITQKGTGAKADLWECPTGMYRWFVLEDRTLAQSIRFKRPRYGWKKD